jgi:hypothetical protein
MRLRAVDDVFYGNTPMRFQSRTAGYASDQQVEDALRRQTGVAALAARPGCT